MFLPGLEGKRVIVRTQSIEDDLFTAKCVGYHKAPHMVEPGFPIVEVGRGKKKKKLICFVGVYVHEYNKKIWDELKDLNHKEQYEAIKKYFITNITTH